MARETGPLCYPRRPFFDHFSAVSRRFHFRPGFALLVLAMLVLMVNLGFWQLRRAEEKRVLLALAAAQSEQAPVSLVEALDAEDAHLRPVRTDGVFQASYDWRVSGNDSAGRRGVWRLAWLHVGEDWALLVNRGWQALPAASSSTPEPVAAQPSIAEPVVSPSGSSAMPAADSGTPAIAAAVSGAPAMPGTASGPAADLPAGLTVTVAGQLFRPSEPFMSAPLPAAGLQTVEWPVFDFATMRAAWQQELDRRGDTGRRILPYTLRLAADQPHGFKRQWTVISGDPAKHTGYAVQWFAMSAALLLLFFWFSFRAETPDDKS